MRKTDANLHIAARAARAARVRPKSCTICKFSFVFLQIKFLFFKGERVVMSTQVLSLIFDLEKGVCMLKMIRKTIRLLYVDCFYILDVMYLFFFLLTFDFC